MRFSRRRRPWFEALEGKTLLSAVRPALPVAAGRGGEAPPPPPPPPPAGGGGGGGQSECHATEAAPVRDDRGEIPHRGGRPPAPGRTAGLPVLGPGQRPSPGAGGGQRR